MKTIHPPPEYLTFEFVFIFIIFSVLALVCVVCGQDDPLAALGEFQYLKSLFFYKKKYLLNGQVFT